MQAQQVAGITVEEDEVEQNDSPMVSDEEDGAEGDDPVVSAGDEESEDGADAGSAEEGSEQERVASGARAEASGSARPATNLSGRMQQDTGADAELQVAPLRHSPQRPEQAALFNI